MAHSCVSTSTASSLRLSTLGFSLANPISSLESKFQSLPLEPLCSRSWLLHHPSSQSMKLYSSGLAHIYAGGNALGVLCNLSRDDPNCSLRTTTYTLFRKASLCSPRFGPSCQVKSSQDSEGTSSGESVILDEQTLEWELQNAIEEENYARAAKIRDSLRSLQENGKASLLAANARFYNSFRNGDLATMQGLWSKGENVCVVHPGVSGISGYDLVMGSWEYVWADYEFPLEIEIRDVKVHVKGDLGYVTCVELVKTKGSSWGKQFATNVFERVNGQWLICIHHASHVDLG